MLSLFNHHCADFGGPGGNMDNLSGFDPSTMTYLATQMVHPNGNGGPDSLHDMLLPMDLPDHQSTYGYAGSEDVNLQMQQHPQTTPQLKRFSSAYEDPFSDVVSAFDHHLNNAEQQDPDAPSIDRDHKLLSFSLPSFDYALLDYTYRRTTASLTAQLHGMFFLAESPWAAAGDAQAPPSELTCYRRNLFQITGELTLPRTLRYIMTEQGEQIPIIGQELVVSATESTEGNSVKIISVPWKTPANPNAPVVEDKVEREPPSIPLDLMNVQDVDAEYASFPFQWKRLQFRIATANNGRRKELQQHFVVRLKVLATLATGGQIPICEVQSGAIIVRGRSPRNFQSRKDLPLNGSGSVRKNSHMPTDPARSSTGDSVKKLNLTEARTSAPMAAPAPPHSATRPFFSPTSDHEFFEWPAPEQPHGGAATAVAHSQNGAPAVDAYPQSSPELSRVTKSAPQPPAPINLSLVEDDSPRSNSNGSPPDHPRPAKRMHLTQRAPSFTLNTLNSPDEAADLLYEYFPLGLDDWMPPVDAVYRPHVVHHLKTSYDPRDPRVNAKSARSKRYFTEDM